MSAARWGHYLGSAVTYGWVKLRSLIPCKVILVKFSDWAGLWAVFPIALDCVGTQAMLPHWLVPLFGLCVQAGSLGKPHGWMGPQAMFCDQVRLQTRLQSWAKPQTRLCNLAVLCCWA